MVILLIPTTLKLFNAEFMPPDFTNTKRALRLNPREALNEWLEEIAEEL